MVVVEKGFELFSLNKWMLSKMLQVEILSDYSGLLSDTSLNELDSYFPRLYFWIQNRNF